MTASAVAGGRQISELSLLFCQRRREGCANESQPKRINVTVTGATITLLDAQQRELRTL